MVKGDSYLFGYFKKMFKFLKITPPSVMAENRLFNGEEAQ